MNFEDALHRAEEIAFVDDGFGIIPKEMERLVARNEWRSKCPCLPRGRYKYYFFSVEDIIGHSISVLQILNDTEFDVVFFAESKPTHCYLQHEKSVFSVGD